MYNDRIVIPFPSDTIRLNGVLQGDTIRLNGVLQDTLSAIHCATSNLTYKDYLRISSTFLFVSELVFANALKSLSTRSEIYFDSAIAVSYAEKNMGNISEEMILASLLIASIEKTLSLYSEFSFSTDATFSSEKSFSKLKNELGLFIETEFAAKKSLFTDFYTTLDCTVGSTTAEKRHDRMETMLAIESALNLVAEKYSGFFISDTRFKETVKFAVARFRKLADIDWLTFADIDKWDMDTFDMLVD